MAYSFDSRIRFSEVGSDGKLTLGKIIDYFQDCSNYQSETLGVGYYHQRETGRAWLLNAWDIRIQKRAELGSPVLLRTWPSGFNKVFGSRCYEMCSLENEQQVLAQGVAHWFLFDVEKQNITRIREEDTKCYLCEPPFGWEEKNIRMLPAVDYQVLEPVTVMAYHQDVNAHMNNAWYIKIAEEYVKDKDAVNRIRVNYKQAAKYQEQMYPYVAAEAGRTLVEFRNEEDKLYAAVEFISEV